ncbi:hypothetical protein [Haloarchaeobius amylolyticus]|uniref:hypothetical protein n=1 Tax=Haloarchaeobius amylolyticus TaxID=1198296 RepID=UPI00226DF387|nr:hypothetical protein [Haloarchaeobius amylolyticus]
MLRTVLLLFGLLEFLFPKQVIDFMTKRAYTTPEEFEVKPWVLTVARVEGLVFVLLALKGKRCRSKSANETEA